jgi:uncharacterized phage protein (TIGR01671 family)
MWSGKRMYYDIEEVMECLMQQMAFDHKDETTVDYNHVGDGSAFLQFTGLKDKNGKEIYEGDIVTGKAKNDFRWPMRGKVEFINGGFAFNVGQQSLDNDNDYYCYPWTHDDFEVIGNIYEHSHLLKTEQ